MPVLSTPTQNDRALAYDPPGQRPFWGHFGLQATGKTLIRESGVWSAVSYPTQTRLEAADNITDTNGASVPGYFLGGHVATITQAVADELTAQGFGAYVS